MVGYVLREGYTIYFSTILPKTIKIENKIQNYGLRTQDSRKTCFPSKLVLRKKGILHP